jgi:putative phage-type endonuclease
MKTHHLIQGSPEWVAYRATVWNASDAPAMMGCSPYKTRDQLLQELATGVTEEITPEQQRRFDDGHRFEALARPLAEQIIGEELAPVVGSSGEVIGGRTLSASFDGIDFMETVAFEHKSLNNDLRACLKDEACGYLLPLVYRVQMEQQLMVSGAQRILFMASKWDSDTLVEKRHCWYYPDEQLAAKIRAGWAQLAVDLANWKPQFADIKPVGKSPEALPALRIEINGAVTASNLSEFKEYALAVFKDIKRDPSTDEEFADAEKTVKWCGDVESRLAAAKEHALSQTADIDALFKAIDDISAEARRVRLDLDKVVKARKEEIRVELVTEHSSLLQAHVDALNTGLGARWVAYPAAAFGEAIKGKKTVASIRDACSVVLAEAKIFANQSAERFKHNRTSLHIEGRDWFSLFPDFATVGNKAPEDFEALAQLRIGKHVEAERVATEAKQRADAAAQAAITAAAQNSAQAAAPVQATAPAAAPVVVASNPSPWVDPAPASANEPASVRLGEICTRVGQGFTMTAAFVEQVLGISPAATDKAAKLYRASDEKRIHAALIRHLQGLHMAKAA